MIEGKDLDQEEIELRTDRLQIQIEPSLLDLTRQVASKRNISTGAFTRFALIRAIHDMSGAIWNPKND
jgi:hypothetical protein